MGKADALFERFGSHHRNPLNKAAHWICVPLIVWSVLGLLWSASPLVAYAAGAAALAFYLWLSVPLALGMAVVLVVMLYALTWLGERTLVVSAVVFVAAWIGQFMGHAIERSRPIVKRSCGFEPLIWPPLVCGMPRAATPSRD